MESTNSLRLTLHSLTMAGMSIRESAAATTMAASAASGRWRKVLGAAIVITSRVVAAATPASWVRAPRDSATGVRELLPLTANPWKKPEATLASPSATSSWLLSTCSWRLMAIARESTLVSANDTSATPSAAPNRVRVVSHPMSGRAGVGIPEGRSPTRFTPRLPRSSRTAARMPTITATRGAGMRRARQRSKTMTATHIAPTPNAQPLNWPSLRPSAKSPI